MIRLAVYDQNYTLWCSSKSSVAWNIPQTGKPKTRTQAYTWNKEFSKNFTNWFPSFSTSEAPTLKSEWSQDDDKHHIPHVKVLPFEVMHVLWHLGVPFYSEYQCRLSGVQRKARARKAVAAKNNWFVCTEKNVQRALLWQWAAGIWRICQH